MIVKNKYRYSMYNKVNGVLIILISMLFYMQNIKKWNFVEYLYTYFRYYS